jgi:hypothetical protein
VIRSTLARSGDSCNVVRVFARREPGASPQASNAPNAATAPALVKKRRRPINLCMSTSGGNQIVNKTGRVFYEVL